MERGVRILGGLQVPQAQEVCLIVQDSVSIMIQPSTGLAGLEFKEDNAWEDILDSDTENPISGAGRICVFLQQTVSS